MDLSERLSEEDLARPDYLSASHLHRYALAAALCAGSRVLDVGCGTGYGTAMLSERGCDALGVDIDPEAVRQATGSHPNVTFEEGDALTRLRATGGEDVEAVVMFEALEHVPDPERVLQQLRRLRAAGVRLVVSVPNSQAFRERNEFHITDYGWTEARRAFANIDGAVLLYQYLAEGSLVVSEEAGCALDGEVAALDQAEPEYANTFICAAGFEPGAVTAASARLNLVARPSHNRYMLDLERANTEVFRANRQLARGLMGKHDAAAATLNSRYETEIAYRDRLVADLDAEVKTLAAELAQERAWRDAPRYHLVDRLAAAIRAVPGVAQVAAALWWVLRRAFRQRSQTLAEPELGRGGFGDERDPHHERHV